MTKQYEAHIDAAIAKAFDDFARKLGGATKAQRLLREAIAARIAARRDAKEHVAQDCALLLTTRKEKASSATLKLLGLEEVPAKGENLHSEYYVAMKDAFDNPMRSVNRALAQHAQMWCAWDKKVSAYVARPADEKEIARSTGSGAKAPKAESAKADGDKVPLIDVVVSNIMHLERTEENWNRVIEALEARWESDPDTIAAS